MWCLYFRKVSSLEHEVRSLVNEKRADQFRSYSDKIAPLIIDLSTEATAGEGQSALLAEIAPDRLMLKNLNSLAFLKAQLPRIESLYKRHTTTYQKVFIRDKKNSLRALKLLRSTIEIMSNRVAFKSDIRYNVLFAANVKASFFCFS